MYSRKFGGLAVYSTTTKLKSAKISYSHIGMAISYQTAKFKSDNILKIIVILGPIAKFNSRQYFRLYGNNYSDACKHLPSLDTCTILYLFTQKG